MIDAMKKAGVKRLVVLSALGTGESGAATLQMPSLLIPPSGRSTGEF